jgi:hypothetical protein
MMVFLIPQDGAGTVNLLSQDKANQLVRENKL